MRSVFIVFVVMCFLCTPCFGEKGLRFKLKGKEQTILPIGHSNRMVLGVKQNGYIVELQPNDIKDPVVIPRFAPFTQSQARGELLREFGKSYEVTGTGSYLVVHPRGSRDLWANRFEQLYRSMTHFFKTRGFPLKKPQFPLVGIVFHSKSQYVDYCRRVLKTSAADAVGLYMHDTNRIYLFDATQGKGTQSKEWEYNLATIMHEVAHQTAFNSGIHVRRSGTPSWVTEGLGCLFEAKGIYDSSRFRKREHRINLGRIYTFNKNSIDDVEHQIMSMIASDKLFKRDPLKAYATAWALTFYLSERQPREYVRYLKMVAKHQPFDGYTSKQRISEFSHVYGNDYRQLASILTRYMQDMPVPDWAR